MLHDYGLVTCSALMDSEVLLAVFGSPPVVLVALNFTLNISSDFVVLYIRTSFFKLLNQINATFHTKFRQYPKATQRRNIFVKSPYFKKIKLWQHFKNISSTRNIQLSKTTLSCTSWSLT